MSDFLGLTPDELQLFLDEMTEHLEVVETELLQLEKSGVDPERVARIFRSAHTIKGAAATVGLDGMAKLTHAMETIFDRMRAGTMFPAPAEMDLLFAAADVLSDMLAEIVEGKLPREPSAELITALMGAAEQPTPAGNAQTVKRSVEVHVRFDPGCPMPAVRALQVLLALEPLGQVYNSDPTEEAINAEQVADCLSVWLHTEHSPEAIKQSLVTISDVIAVDVALTESVVVGLTVDEGLPRESPSDAVPAAAESRPASRAAEDRTIRVDVTLLDRLMNLVGELVIDRGRLGGISQLLKARPGSHDLAEELDRVTAHLARVTGALQESVLKARMLPIERAFRKFPRMVRDLAQALGKQVDFQMSGEETELDRSLIEVIGDPLLHLIRNAMDHGLEDASTRRQVGKPETGVIRLMAAHEENHVLITVQDDGKGINTERVRATAVERGLISGERARELTESEALQLLFAPGFSTAEKLTDVSGRGVGLDVVRRNIEQVGGRIEIESKPGMGTTFRLLLPLTLATIRALLVQVNQETLALPLSTVAETLRVERQELVSLNRRWVIRVRGRVVPLLWLKQFLAPGTKVRPGEAPVLVVLVSYRGEPVGLVVDGLLGEQEVVVKGLGSFFGHVRGVGGATILGDGGLALILDVNGVIGTLIEDASSLAESPSVQSGVSA